MNPGTGPRLLLSAMVVPFADPCDGEPIGTQCAGPTWQSKDGSLVVAARLAGCTPHRGAIPWLKLRATEDVGHGRFESVT